MSSRILHVAPDRTGSPWRLWPPAWGLVLRVLKQVLDPGAVVMQTCSYLLFFFFFCTTAAAVLCSRAAVTLSDVTSTFCLPARFPVLSHSLQNL